MSQISTDIYTESMRIIPQAVGQMINDDWCYGASQEWENADADSDWRYTGLPDSDNFAVLSDKEPIDIEGVLMIQ